MRLIDVLPSERRRVATLWAVGLAYAAAINLGDSVSASIFVTRLGAPALAQMFLAKGLFDVLAAACYLPLTRGRSPRRVLEVALAIYAVTMLAGRAAITSDASVSAYALYLGHECAGTILTIHWAVYCLDLFDASAARRLFPLIFTATRVGGIVGGTATAHLAHPLGAENLLFGAAGLALVGIVIAWRQLDVGHGHGAPSPDGDVATSADNEGGADGLLSGWRQAFSSPLVKAIALSTVTMVFLRYGLKLLAIDAFRVEFADADGLTRFLGSYSAWANAAAIGLALLVTPRLIAALGAGFVNVTYALATAASYLLLLIAPSLTAAVTARFVDTELKDALKTPLSALFYGAEPPERRAPARAFMFGAVIPAATILTSVIFQIATDMHGTRALVYAGLVVAAAFVIASAWQNGAWRRRLTELLAWKLARQAADLPATTPPLPAELAAHATDPDAVSMAWRALASREPRLRAVGVEVLSEVVPRRLARKYSR